MTNIFKKYFYGINYLGTHFGICCSVEASKGPLWKFFPSSFTHWKYRTCSGTRLLPPRKARSGEGVWHITHMIYPPYLQNACWKEKVAHVVTNENVGLVIRVAGDKARKIGNSHLLLLSSATIY